MRSVRCRWMWHISRIIQFHEHWTWCLNAKWMQSELKLFHCQHHGMAEISCDLCEAICKVEKWNENRVLYAFLPNIAKGIFHFPTRCYNWINRFGNLLWIFFSSIFFFVPLTSNFDFKFTVNSVINFYLFELKVGLLRF